MKIFFEIMILFNLSMKMMLKHSLPQKSQELIQEIWYKLFYQNSHMPWIGILRKFRNNPPALPYPS